MSDETMRIDEARRNFFRTGIPILAMNFKGQWETADIGDLTPESLWTWLRSRGGENRWAESVVFMILGHHREDMERVMGT